MKMSFLFFQYIEDGAPADLREIFDKSSSGLIPLISPILIRRSYLALTVGVLTLISLEMARKDLRPSSISDFRMAASVSSSSMGMIQQSYCSI